MVAPTHQVAHAVGVAACRQWAWSTRGFVRNCRAGTGHLPLQSLHPEVSPGSWPFPQQPALLSQPLWGLCRSGDQAGPPWALPGGGTTHVQYSPGVSTSDPLSKPWVVSRDGSIHMAQRTVHATQSYWRQGGRGPLGQPWGANQRKSWLPEGCPDLVGAGFRSEGQTAPLTGRGSWALWP